MRALSLLILSIHYVSVAAQDSCANEPDDVVNAIAAQAGYIITDGCDSTLVKTAISSGFCTDATQKGQTLRTYCCKSCIDHHFPMPEIQLPEDGGIGAPVKLYLQAGQSECKGQASTDLLREYEGDTGTYSDLVIEQNDVYIAGYNEYSALGTPDESRFFVARMGLGKEGKSGAFGPEIAIGRRIQDASPSDTDIMIVKYCWGGSNVANQWNPSKPANYWDRTTDDGSSDYLLTSGAADLKDKNSLFANLIYTARRAAEALEEANVDYEWAGMFWIQGNADKDSTWEEYGDNLKLLFTQVRNELGSQLPIIDNGADVMHSLYSGKIYSASTIANCNVKVAQSASTVQDLSSDCVPSASAPCPVFTNYPFFDHYGIDPVLTVPPHSDGIPAYLLDKNFTWYKSYPDNLHSEYDGMIWKGNMLANEFIRTFTDWTLTPEMTADDPIVLFPPKICDDPPADDNVCYIDQRDDQALSDAICDIDTGEALRRKLRGGQ